MGTKIQPLNYRFLFFLIAGLLLGVILSLTYQTELITAGLIIYGIASFGVLLFGLYIANQDLLKSLIIWLTGLLSSMGVISAFLIWPYMTEIRLLNLVSILGFGYLLVSRKLTKLEIILLLILNADLAVKVVQIFNR